MPIANASSKNQFRHVHIRPRVHLAHRSRSGALILHAYCSVESKMFHGPGATCLHSEDARFLHPLPLVRLRGSQVFFENADTPTITPAAETGKRNLRRLGINRGVWSICGRNEGTRRKIRPQAGRRDRRAPHLAEHRGSSEGRWPRSPYASALAESARVSESLPGGAPGGFRPSRRTAPARDLGSRHDLLKTMIDPTTPASVKVRAAEASSITRARPLRSRTSKHAYPLWRRQLEMADDENDDPAASEA